MLTTVPRITTTTTCDTNPQSDDCFTVLTPVLGAFRCLMRIVGHRSQVFLNECPCGFIIEFVSTVEDDVLKTIIEPESFKERTGARCKVFTRFAMGGIVS